MMIITFFASLTITMFMLMSLMASTAKAAYGPDLFVIFQNVNSFYVTSGPSWTMKYIQNKPNGPQSGLLDNLDATPRALSIEQGISSTEFADPTNINSFAGFGTIKNIDRCKNITTFFGARGATNPVAGAFIKNHTGTGATNVLIFEDGKPTITLNPGQIFTSKTTSKNVVSAVSVVEGDQTPYELCTYAAWDFTPQWLGIATVWSQPSIVMTKAGFWNPGSTAYFNLHVSTDQTTTVKITSSTNCNLTFDQDSFTVTPNQSPPFYQLITVGIPTSVAKGTVCTVYSNGDYKNNQYPTQLKAITID